MTQVYLWVSMQCKKHALRTFLALSPSWIRTRVGVPDGYGRVRSPAKAKSPLSQTVPAWTVLTEEALFLDQACRMNMHNAREPVNYFKLSSYDPPVTELVLMQRSTSLVAMHLRSKKKKAKTCERFQHRNHSQLAAHHWHG